MEPTPEIDHARSSVVAYPTMGPVAIPKADWFTIWGPLGVGWMICLAGLVALWRASRKEKQEDSKALAEANRLLIEQARAHAQQLEQMARDHAQAHVAISEKLYQLAGSLRDVLDATGKRIIR